LFSEFTAMMMIARAASLESDPRSFKAKYAKTAEAKDFLGDVLPFAGSIHTY